MNVFEKDHRIVTRKFKKYVLVEIMANELKNYFEINQGYEEDDKYSPFTLSGIYEECLKIEKYKNKEQNEIIKKAILLANIKYGIKLESEKPLIFTRK